MAREYYERIYDNVLSSRLEAKGAVLVEGPKWCGKTTTAKQRARSAVYLQDPRTRAQNLRLAELDPSKILEGEAPRLVDEWQDAPSLWDAVRYEVDERDEFGQFILTGSSVPADFEKIAHTGTGRVARMRMRPMALAESRDSSACVSLAALFEGAAPVEGALSSDLEQLAFLACRGGWPKAVGQASRIALRQAFDYLDAVTEVDISRVDGVRRNADHARMIMRSYARMVSSQGTLASMQADINGAGVSMGASAFSDYIEALRKMFVIEDLAAWNPNLRSKTAIRTSPTRHFVDPSIAVAALGAGPDDLMEDLETFGLLFESMCIRDLRVYADALDGSVYHYRDKTGLECDAVVHLRNGSYGLVEVKLGGEAAIEEGAASLKALADKVDTSRMRAPSFSMVLTGTGEFSYPREDGVLVVPVRALGA